MTAPHVDGEDLARLAMQDEVPAEVTAHVAGCAECARDLALIRSLLAADGPDGPAEVGDALDDDDLETDMAEATGAWADANDTRAASVDSATQTPRPTPQPEPIPDATTTAGRRTNSTALVVALLLFVGAVLLALVALR